MISKFHARFKNNLELKDKVSKRNIFKLTSMCKGIAPSHGTLKKSSHETNHAQSHETFRKNPAGYRFF